MNKLISFSLLVVFILSSCKSTKIVEIPVETIKTLYVDKVKYDSIYSKDSVYIMQKGDTVYNTKVQYVYKYRYLKDTILITDTIPRIVHVTLTLYINKLYPWLRSLMVVGIIPLVLFIVYVGKLIKQLTDKLNLKK